MRNGLQIQFLPISDLYRLAKPTHKHTKQVKNNQMSHNT